MALCVAPTPPPEMWTSMGYVPPATGERGASQTGFTQKDGPRRPQVHYKTHYERKQEGTTAIALRSKVTQGTDQKLSSIDMIKLQAQRAKEEAEARARAQEAASKKAMEEEAKMTPREMLEARCLRECMKAPIQWQGVQMDTVQNGHEKRSPGMIYGLEFPWSEALLVEFGPAWLTKAFHAVGSMKRSNKVTKIITYPEKSKVTAGNNAAKFIFEVRYAERTPGDGLHEKLFAKIPYPLGGVTYSDRLSSSVYKQPMDFYEINTYRFGEAGLPVKTPKFYFGDISNETTNFMAIMERVDFVDPDQKREKLNPFEVEGCYHKCKDFQLRGPAKEYYMKIVESHAKIAGGHKSGCLGADSFLKANLNFSSQDISAYPINPNAATGANPAVQKTKVQVALKFITETAHVLFPDYVLTEAFQEKFMRVLMTKNLYNGEIEYWKNHNYDYVSLGHQNLNMDNAAFWRDEEGKLDCLLFDWGGFGSNSLAHRLWWGFNCAEFEQLKDNWDEYIDFFIDEYEEHGGPRLDHKILSDGMALTAIGNLEFMVAAVPNALKMCGAKEWPTIKDRHDPRISSDVDGKTTLRTTLQVMLNGVRMIQEFGADKVLDRFTKETYCSLFQQQKPKDIALAGI